MKRDLPKCVYLKHGAFWYVKRNKWHRLSDERRGLPAMYRSLAAFTDAEHMRDFMPAVITRWLDSRELAPSTREDYERYCSWLASEFAGKLPDSVTTKDCADCLRKITKPRTFNESEESQHHSPHTSATTTHRSP